MEEQHADILSLIGSRRYCFVIMPYGSLGLLYDHVRQVIQEATGLKCIRADEISGPSQSVLGKVHKLIEDAELMIAELSEERANVYYEVGYALARGKKVFIICKQGTKIPTDLEGLERLEYADTPSALPQFDQQLRVRVAGWISPPLRRLRAMLVAPEPSPSFVLCSPRWRVRDETETPAEQGTSYSGPREEERTYGDYLGVQGILYALGTLLGEERLPELLSAHHAARDIHRRDANLYLIGSPRSNRFTEEVMARLQEGQRNPWRFQSDPSKSITVLTGPGPLPGGRWEADHSQHNPEEDYGLVLRGPHPGFPQKQVLVLAGARSLGTGAACLAATRLKLLQDIEGFRAVDLNDKTQRVWALVRGRPHPVDGHVYEDGVDIVDVGVLR